MTTKPIQNKQNNITDKSYNAPTGIFSFARNAVNEVNNKPNLQSPPSNSTPPPSNSTPPPSEKPNN